MKFALIAFLMEALGVMGHNTRWMSWNLFLAIVPLFLSFFLFCQPRSRWFLWATAFLLGITFLPNIRLVFWHLHPIVQELGLAYLLGAIAITLGLMAVDFWVLRQQGVRSLRWWVGFLLWIAFLPNAPYVLTDIIHLIQQIQARHSVWIITLALIPQYLGFIIAGFQAYVLSVMNFGNYLRHQGGGKFILMAELLTHGLAAIGIYLGRFVRFNSWDIIANPDELFNTVMNDLLSQRPLVLMVVTFVIITCLYWVMQQINLGISQRFYGTKLRSIQAKGNPTSPSSI